MLIKLFALGRPGSGKSVAAHRLAEAAWNNGLPAIRLGDYELLHREALREEDACLGEVSSAPAKRRFYITEHNGFGVYDFTVLDDVLIALRTLIHSRANRASIDHQLVIIEIARDNYQHAFEVLGPDVLEDAFFLYVDAEVERCIKRINERTLHPTSSDDHYVPDHILRTYYEKDDGSDIGRYLMQAYGVPDGRIMMARNNGTHSEFTAQITTITETILTKLSAWNAA